MKNIAYQNPDPWQRALRDAGNDRRRLRALAMLAIAEINSLQSLWKADGLTPPQHHTPPSWEDDADVREPQQLKLTFGKWRIAIGNEGED